MKQKVLLLLAVCMCVCSCGKLTTSEKQWHEYNVSITDNPSNVEDMARFLDEAHKRVVCAEKHLAEQDGKEISFDHVLGLSNPKYLINEDGTLYAYVSIHPGYAYTYEYRWRIDEKDHMKLICTDEKGEEYVSRLMSCKDGNYYFEGAFPAISLTYAKIGDNDEDIYYTYDRMVVRSWIDGDEQYRKKVKSWYDATKAENEKK